MAENPQIPLLEHDSWDAPVFTAANLLEAALKVCELALGAALEQAGDKDKK